MGSQVVIAERGKAAMSFFLRVSASPREPIDFLFARRRGDAEKKCFEAAFVAGDLS